MKKKIDLMYEFFGKRDGCYCRECSHFQRHRYKCKTYRKCDVYGETSSEATDWAGRNTACGLLNAKYNGRPVIELKKHLSHKKEHEIIDGQIIFEI